MLFCWIIITFYLIHAETHQRQSLGHWSFNMRARLSSQKLRMTEDQQLIDYLLLLRFGTSDVGQAARPVLNYASITKVVRNEY